MKRFVLLAVIMLYSVLPVLAREPNQFVCVTSTCPATKETIDFSAGTTVYLQCEIDGESYGAKAGSKVKSQNIDYGCTSVDVGSGEWSTFQCYKREDAVDPPKKFGAKISFQC
ncbi:MAG: hypothetical protein AAGI44_07545 [Pseudomonadota bacterium]